MKYAPDPYQDEPATEETDTPKPWEKDDDGR